MTQPPAAPAKKKKSLLFVLLLLLLAVVSAIFWNTKESIPPWLENFLYLKMPPVPKEGKRPEPDAGLPPLPVFPHRASPPSSAQAPAANAMQNALPGVPLSGHETSPAPEQEHSGAFGLNATISPLPANATHREDGPLPAPPPAGGNATLPEAPAGRDSGLLSQDPEAEPETQAPSRNPDVPETPSPRSPVSREEDQTPATTSIIVYEKARPISRDGNVVEGKTSAPANSRGMGSSSRENTAFSAMVRSGEEDQVVGMAFVVDLARFMAANYWPAGTHPQARGRGITTAGIKWANLRYGSQLHGMAARGKTPAAARRELLGYVLMPSMIKGLYGLYIDRFMAALAGEAGVQKRGSAGKERPLTSAELVEMYELYAARMQGLAGAMRTYLSTPGIRERVEQYRQAKMRADETHAGFLEAQAAKQVTARVSRVYQEAVIRREQARENIAASLRRGGRTKGLDTDTLVFSALWLYRREGVSPSALESLAGILEDCSSRLKTEGARRSAARAQSHAHEF